MRKIFLLALAALFACTHVSAPAYRSEAVTRGPVSQTVNATGDVSALVTVSVGSQVSGIVDKLFVDFNTPVHKGQVLATLDTRLFVAALERADAGLAAANANVDKAQAVLADSQRTASRDMELANQRLIAQAELDTAIAARDANAAALSSAKAAALQAKADRDQARVNLEFTNIKSPIDGVVVSRSIDVGQTVAAAFQAPTLFVIANDLTKMQILANIDEADVGKVQEGLQARFTVDAYPGETFTGTVRQVREAATTTNNVVTYAAVIDAANPDRKLRQGMTASVTIVNASRDDVLRISNAALRFRPDAPPAQAQQKTAPQGRAASPLPREPGKSATVFKLENGKPVAVSVHVGIADGQRTEVVDGLTEGDQIIVGSSSSNSSSAPAQPQSRGGSRGPF
jgi:HlyD family secretion protein